MEIVKPIAGIPLRHPCICKGRDGIWYMTGTEGPDFDNNSCIHLWKSMNLKYWECIGKVWDVETGQSQRGWVKKWKPVAGKDKGRLFRGIRAPEIHYVKGGYYITYSMNWGGTGLLCSETGKPEGPYEDIGRITVHGCDASMFEDDDGAVYWVYGEGWIARMKDDLSGIAERPVLLQPQVHSKTGDFPATVGDEGAFIFKYNGKYILLCGQYFHRLGRVCYDTFAAVSDNIYGPYGKRYLFAPHCGQTTVFPDDTGTLYCTFSGDDDFAVFRDLPSFVPLAIDHNRGQYILKKSREYVLEDTPMARLKPKVDVWMRDTQVISAPDGYYYMCGTTGLDGKKDKEEWKSVGEGIELFRSDDLESWEPLGMVWRCDDAEWTREIRFHEKSGAWRRAVWAPEIHYIKGNYYIAFCMNFGGTGVLRSTTRKAEGPYECIAQLTESGIDASLFEDDDGCVYFIWGCTNIARMKEDMTGFAEAPRRIGPDKGPSLGYEGSYMLKIDGKYILLGSDWTGEDFWEEGWNYGSYDLTCCVAENIYGPYSHRKLLLPHCGHCNLFQDQKNRWWCTFFGSDASAPYLEKPSLMPVEISWKDGDLIVVPLDVHL